MTRPRLDPTHPLVVRIPRSLFDEVRLQLIDPRYGIVQQGAWPHLMCQLLRDWLAQQRIQSIDQSSNKWWSGTQSPMNEIIAQETKKPPTRG
jgi:hypothetical protein